MGTDPAARLYYGFTQQRDNDGDFVTLTLDEITMKGLATPAQRALFAQHAEEAQLDEIIGQLDDDDDEDTSDEGPWNDHHGDWLVYKPWRVHVGLIGSDYELGFFLAIPESLLEADWHKVVDFDVSHFKVGEDWDARLWAAVKDWGLNVHEDKPGWHLSALYF